MRKPASKSNPAPTTATTPVRARTQFPEWLIAPLLVLVTVGLYCPVTGFDFLNYDDPEFVTRIKPPPPARLVRAFFMGGPGYL